MFKINKDEIVTVQERLLYNIMELLEKKENVEEKPKKIEKEEPKKIVKKKETEKTKRR